MSAGTGLGRSMQDEHTSLLEQAKSLPGVVELTEMYGRIEAFDRYDVNTTATHVTYGVGGNA